MNIGTPVSWVSCKDGKKHTGVIIAMKGKRYEVRAPTGTWRVPPHMLKSEKALAPKEAQELLHKGKEHHEKKVQRKSEYKDEKARRMLIIIGDLMIGQKVQVYNKLGWSDTRVVALDLEKGKVTVINPVKTLFKDMGRHFPTIHAFLNEMTSRIDKKRDVITVWADRIRY